VKKTVKQNLGKLDRIFRFLLAFWWLSPWAPTFAATWGNWLILILAWVFLVESFIGWCPLGSALGITNKNQ
jgi:hypothetical protein